MATEKKVLEIAKAELGIKESPANSNKVKYNNWYYGSNVSGSAYPWCMAFVQWVYNQAGVKLPIKTASCGALMNAAKKENIWYTGSYKPGDIVIYNFHGSKVQTDHCGIIESVQDSTVTAIEGNTSSDEKGSQSNGGMVCRKKRSKSLIIGVVRPKFIIDGLNKQEPKKEDEDDMDISKLTDEQVLQLANRIQNVLGKREATGNMLAEMNEAKDLKITDGTNPYAFCTRMQAAIMAKRAIAEQK